MKKCPKCGSQYSDVTLSFCLQDGTPLTVVSQGDTPTQVLGEEETVAARRNVVSGPTAEQNSRTWDQSQVTRVASGQAEKKGSNTPLAVAFTVVGMLVLFGIIGTVAIVFLRNSPQARGSNLNITPNTNFGSYNGNGRSAPYPTPLATASPMRAPISSTNSDQPPSSTPNVTDDSQSRGDVSQNVYGWKSALESGDLNGYMGNYASILDRYYTKNNVGVGAVRADKARAFERYTSKRVSISNLDVSVAGDTATATFDKEWTFSGGGTSAGKTRTQLNLRKVGGRWLITSERDIRVYYTR